MIDNSSRLSRHQQCDDALGEGRAQQESYDDVSPTKYSHSPSSHKALHSSTTTTPPAPLMDLHSTPPTSPILRNRRSMSAGSSSSSNSAINFEASNANENQNNTDDDHQQSSQSTTTTRGQDEDDIIRPTTTASTNTSISRHDMLLLQQFWQTYDTIIILSIFAIFGIAFRMMSATWFRSELGSVFSEDSALGTNLPLNIWSCFLMGLLCSGRDAMGIVHSKVLGGSNLYGSSDGRGIVDVGKGAYRGVIDAGRAGINRVRGYGNVNNPNMMEASSSDECMPESSSSISNGLHRRRRGDSIEPQSTDEQTTRIDSGNHNDDGSSIAGLLGLDEEFRIIGSHKTSEDEIREVQLRGLSRRIMASPSLVFFPAKKEDHDVMEHYESEAQTESQDNFEIGNLDDNNDIIEAGGDIEMRMASGEASGQQHTPSQRLDTNMTESQRLSPTRNNDNNSPINNNNMRSQSSTIEEHVDEIIHTINDHVTTFQRIRIVDGWSIITSPEQTKHMILLGLRVGFCGALSTFSSLNASVIRLLRAGSIGEALVGYALSIQLGIVSYRFGQHIAVYIFVWRCRRETRRDERRGGRRLATTDDEHTESADAINVEQHQQRSTRWRFISVRSIATLMLAAMITSLSLAIYFVPNHQQYLLSLLFTPFGCLARWRLMDKYNKKVPGFPLGTFCCNVGGCALSGSLASFLAGNPDPEESVVLTSMIAGFAGSLSTFAAFIVEILFLIDPLIFKFDGIVYAMITILWALIIGFLGSQAKNFADEI